MNRGSIAASGRVFATALIIVASGSCGFHVEFGTRENRVYDSHMAPGTISALYWLPHCREPTGIGVADRVFTWHCARLTFPRAVVAAEVECGWRD